MSKPKNLKQAMNNDSYIVKSIYAKGCARIRINFKPRFPDKIKQHCSFWINRDYFIRNYPNTYSRF